jgi:type I restriction enzyme S subunit
MSIREVALDALIEPAALERAGDRDVPILSMTMHEGLVDQASKFKKRVASTDTANYKLVRRNQLVVGFPIDEGVLSFQDLHDAAIVSPAYDIWNLRTTHAIESAYLERFLRSPRALAYYRAKLRGTTARRRTLPDDVFLQLRVPLPSSAEQRRIAAILDKADALRTKRRAVLAQLDTLTQSIFLDMFGDPATNPKGWPMERLAVLGEITTGKTPPTKNDGMFGGDVPFATPSDLDVGLEYTQRTLTHEGASYAKLVRAGSALVGCIGNIGKMAQTPVRTAFNQQINAIEWRDAIADDYSIAALGFAVPQMLALASSTTVPILNKSGFSKVRIPVPPLAMQNEFANRLQGANRLRKRVQASQARLDALFASLQHRAFRGEL